MCVLPSSLAVLELLVLAQNASLTTEARRHRMVPRDHNDGFMALYDAFFCQLLFAIGKIPSPGDGVIVYKV